MVALGTDAFRVNFSHGTDDEHRSTLRRLRAAAERAHRDVALVADLQGPKLRLGELRGGSVDLTAGRPWRLDLHRRPGDLARCGVTIRHLEDVARPGDPILLGDGSVELEVTRAGADSIDAVVRNGGIVPSHAGMFLPRARLRRTILGPKDRRDLELALAEDVDFVALSFVRAASDVESVRRALVSAGRPDVGLIAKIERAEALDRVDPILASADAIMVARGDLGIEVPLERLALAQKHLVARANAARKPVIVATQMLVSMVSNPRPTRAEATDVANAVLDGADAVMLSEESAVGRYPVESVGWLDRICRTTEAAVRAGEVRIARPAAGSASPEEAVATAAVHLAEEVGAVAIATPTHTGRTARLVAAHRPTATVHALSALATTRRRLALSWGVESHACPAGLPLERMRTFVQELIGRESGVRSGDPVVLTAGYPVLGKPTNLVTVLSAGRPRGSGRPRARRARARS